MDHDDAPDLLVRHFGQVLDVVVLEEDLRLAHGPAVQFETDQELLARLAVRHDPLFVAKGQKTVAPEEIGKGEPMREALLPDPHRLQHARIAELLGHFGPVAVAGPTGVGGFDAADKMGLRSGRSHQHLLQELHERVAEVSGDRLLGARLTGQPFRARLASGARVRCAGRRAEERSVQLVEVLVVELVVRRRCWRRRKVAAGTGRKDADGRLAADDGRPVGGLGEQVARLGQGTLKEEADGGIRTGPQQLDHLGRKEISILLEERRGVVGDPAGVVLDGKLQIAIKSRFRADVEIRPDVVLKFLYGKLKKNQKCQFWKLDGFASRWFTNERIVGGSRESTLFVQQGEEPQRFGQEHVLNDSIDSFSLSESNFLVIYLPKRGGCRCTRSPRR